MTENEIASIVFSTCRSIFDNLGPGLLEKTYQTILAYELSKTGLQVSTEVAIPIDYDGLHIANAFRIDMIVEDKVIIELKAVDGLHALHKAQLLTYLKLTGKRLGLLINFDVTYIGEGFTRVVNNLHA